ncbi:TetR/AcrR family transcriptional regulator [Methanolobus sp. WCC1]|jgi:AcrR family transcriptional regulator|uniref:TetR/AcrR family transcriptional regulator n=1 Tax=unclassified Methanolobus TaxID=2629569 RepID=UPI003251F09F
MELKDRIINSAHELFSEKGYDKTTVADIIQKAGSSKGGFYHHFKSKEEVIEAITRNYMHQFLLYYDEVLESDSPVIDSINEVLIKITRYKLNQVKDWPKLSRIYSFSGNHIIIKKIADDFEKVTTELYAQLIQRGNKEGIFDVQYPNILAGLWTRELMRVLDRSREAIFSEDNAIPREYGELLDFSEKLFNDTLGLKNNEICIKAPILAYVEGIRKQLGSQIHTSQ